MDNTTTNVQGWISVKERFPEIVEDDESELVLCLGFKMTRPETATYEIMKWTKLSKPDLWDSKGRPIEYGWSNRWWDRNPDLFDVHFWMPLPEPPTEGLVVSEGLIDTGNGNN